MKFGKFFASFAYVIGAIGGFGVACYNHEYVIALCVAVVAAMGFPTAKKFVKELMN